MYKVDPLDESNCMAQRQANLIIELNVVRNMTFNQSVSYWRIWYTVSLPPGTVFMADIDATRSIWFRNVVRMGEGIISRIMTSYLANPNEPWHQFLGAIVYDMVYDLDEETLDRAELYETWRRWYEEQEGAVMVLGYSTEDEDE